MDDFSFYMRPLHLLAETLLKLKLKLNPWLSPEEEKELEEKAEHEWEIDHPEEVRAEELIETRWEELGRNERIYYEE